MNDVRIAVARVLRWHLALVDSLEAHMNVQREYSENGSLELLKRWADEYGNRHAYERQLFKSANTESITQFAPEPVIVRTELPEALTTQHEIVMYCSSRVAWSSAALSMFTFTVEVPGVSELQRSIDALNEAFQQFQNAFDEQNCALITRWLEEWRTRKMQHQQLVEEWLEKAVAQS